MHFIASAPNFPPFPLHNGDRSPSLAVIPHLFIFTSIIMTLFGMGLDKPLVMNTSQTLFWIVLKEERKQPV